MIVLLILVALIFVIVYINKKPETKSPCPHRDNDPNDYFFKTCNYILENNINVTPANPFDYEIYVTYDTTYYDTEAIAVIAPARAIPNLLRSNLCWGLLSKTIVVEI